MPRPCRCAPRLPGWPGRGHRRSRRPPRARARRRSGGRSSSGVQRKVARFSTIVRSASSGPARCAASSSRAWASVAASVAARPRATQAAAPLTTKASRPARAAEPAAVEDELGRAARRRHAQREHRLRQAGAGAARVDGDDRLVAQRRRPCRPGRVVRRDQARRLDRAGGDRPRRRRPRRRPASGDPPLRRLDPLDPVREPDPAPRQPRAGRAPAAAARRSGRGAAAAGPTPRRRRPAHRAARAGRRCRSRPRRAC